MSYSEERVAHPAEGIRIDHIFVFVEPGGEREAGRLAASGLAESYRRHHPGQGTANACYCFDDFYLELLWATDPAELAAPAVAPTRLLERAAWRRNGASPFGIALSTVDARMPLPFEVWGYEAPFLPPGLSLEVACASRDPRQPFLFRSPGNTRPDAWTDGRAGTCQRAAGLAEMTGLRLDFPPDVAPDPAFLRLAELGLLALGRAEGQRLAVSLSRSDGGPDRLLSLPDCDLA
jgi:hypothetical protein